MDQQLMVGILLIVVGVALGLMAAAVVVSRRIDAGEQEAVEPEAAGDAEKDIGVAEPAAVAEPEADTDDLAEVSEQGEGQAEGLESGGMALVDGLGGSAASTDEAASPPAAEGLSESEAVESSPASSGSSLLGELHFDPATGALTFRAGGREYRSGDDIRDRSEYDRLAQAAEDWAGWFEQGRKPAKLAAGGTPSSTSGMVQAIDTILQRSLEGVEGAPRGVRLIQDASGGVRVLIGVKSYEVEEVPDDKVRQLIRDAVAEWEEHQ